MVACAPALNPTPECHSNEAKGWERQRSSRESADLWCVGSRQTSSLSSTANQILGFLASAKLAVAPAGVASSPLSYCFFSHTVPPPSMVFPARPFFQAYAMGSVCLQRAEGEKQAESRCLFRQCSCFFILQWEGRRMGAGRGERKGVGENKG